MQKRLDLGTRQGEARLLLHQLEGELGSVSGAVRAKVESAEEAELLRWSEGMLAAKDLADLFD